jgi:hypothetical protein
MKESRKEFIKKAHSAACSEWKKNIEKEFPKLFKKDKTPYGWYFASNSKVFLYYFDGNTTTYGFNWLGEFRDNLTVSGKDGIKATDQEVKEALIKEAKRRGFKKGVRFTCLYNKTIDSGYFPMLCCDGYLWIDGGCVFKDGVWAEIIKETITKEQAEKELGKTILN